MARPTPREFYRVLHRIADGAVGTVEQAVLRSFGLSAAAVNRAALAAALGRGDIGAALRAINVIALEARLRVALERALRPVFVAAGVATAATTIYPEPGFALRFDLVNPRAVAWARTRAATLVRGRRGMINNGVRGIIRDAIADGLEQQITVQATGRTLRPVLLEALPETLGLTQKQYRSVVNYRARLIAQGVDDATANDRTQKYAAKRLRRRALTIARTETIKASIAGQREAWEQAVELGYLDPETTRREWLVTPDDRLCEICEPIPALNPDGVALGSMFETPVGPIDEPPAHPNCRCALTLNVDADLTTARRVA